MSEQIRNQIQEAQNFLEHAKAMKRRDNDMDRAFAALLAATGRLLEVVLLQQDAIASIRVDVEDLVDAHPYSEKE